MLFHVSCAVFSKCHRGSCSSPNIALSGDVINGGPGRPAIALARMTSSRDCYDRDLLRRDISRRTLLDGDSEDTGIGVQVSPGAPDMVKLLTVNHHRLQL